MSAMIMAVSTTTLFIELEAGHATAWPLTGGAPVYAGPIAGLPPEALAELIQRGVIRPRR